jgi:cysteine synthase A
MQSRTPDFIPKLTGDAVDFELIHRILPIKNAEAMRCSKGLAQRRRSPSGSLRAPLYPGGLHIAVEAPKGATILCMLPDAGKRYLSTPLFAAITAEMTEKKPQVSHSTPMFRRVG